MARPKSFHVSERSKSANLYSGDAISRASVFALFVSQNFETGICSGVAAYYGTRFLHCQVSPLSAHDFSSLSKSRPKRSGCSVLSGMYSTGADRKRMVGETMTENPAILGCEFEVRKRTPGYTFTRHCGELARYYSVKKYDALVGKQKLCHNHALKLREQGFNVEPCSK